MFRSAYLALVALIWVLPFPFTHANSDSLIVDLDTGTFQGFRTENGTENWLGIPFAQPPVGKLRFKAPVALTTKFPGIQNASTFKDACPQRPGDLGAPMGEDCLGLNVRLIYYSIAVTSVEAF